MAFVSVDVSSSSSADYWMQYTQIDGREYLFTFYWNDRASAWYMDVADQDGVPIGSGIKLVCGVALMRAIVDDRKWPGALFCLPSTQDDSDPGHDDLGTRVLLVYNDLQP